MGQWGEETFSGDSPMDYLQHFVDDGDLDKMTQHLAYDTLDYVWKNDGDSYDCFDRLGVVVWLLAHGFIVPVNKIDLAMEYANQELKPSRLENWSDSEKRQAQIIIEMNEMRVALHNKGQGVKREVEAKGLMEKAVDFVAGMTDVAVVDDIKTIKLPCYGIVVVLVEPDYTHLKPRWDGGSITSDLKGICEYCEDPDCDMDCSNFMEYCSDRDMDEQNRKMAERYSFFAHRAAAKAIESIILAHAMADISIEEPAYIEGIEVAVNEAIAATIDTNFEIEG